MNDKRSDKKITKGIVMRLLLIWVVSGILLGACSKSDENNLSGLWIQSDSANFQLDPAHYSGPASLRENSILLIQAQPDTVNNVYVSDPNSREYNGKYIIEVQDGQYYINNGRQRAPIIAIDQNHLTFFNHEYTRVANSCQQAEDTLLNGTDKLIALWQKLQKQGVRSRRDLTYEASMELDPVQNQMFYARDIYAIYSTILQDAYRQQCGVKIADPKFVDLYLQDYLESALSPQ